MIILLFMLEYGKRPSKQSRRVDYNHKNGFYYKCWKILWTMYVCCLLFLVIIFLIRYSYSWLILWLLVFWSNWKKHSFLKFNYGKLFQEFLMNVIRRLKVWNALYEIFMRCFQMWRENLSAQFKEEILEVCLSAWSFELDEILKIEDERWKMKDERWKMKDERWKLKVERWKMKDER